MTSNEKQEILGPGLVIPGYLDEQVIPEVADVLYFEQLLFWLPTGFTPVEFDSVRNFPKFCARENIDLPDIVWRLITWYREADARALDAAVVLKPLKEKGLVKYLLPVYGRGQAEVKAAAAAVSSDKDLRSGLEQVPFDTQLFARELVGHALFGVFVESGYEGSLKVFRNCTVSETSLSDVLGAVVINRLMAMSGTLDNAILYDHRWLPLLQAVQSSKEEGSDTDRQDDALEYSTFRVFSEVLRPVFGRCDEPAKNVWVAEMCRARNQDIRSLRAECRAVALNVLAASDASSRVREEILRRELQQRIIDPLETLDSSYNRDLRKVGKSVLLDSGVVAALLGVFSGFDPRTVMLATGGAAMPFN
jgi:hypothetical protein